MKTLACQRIPKTQFDLGGVVGDYVGGVVDQWLLVAPRANPAMLEIFRDRDATPLRDMVPWAGEFAGKYLTAAVQNLRLTADPRLKAWLKEFVKTLIGLQAADGYLGPWPEDSRLTNFTPYQGEKGSETWDTWGHYHVMMGLMLWHDQTRDKAALAAARRIGDLICRKYLGKKKTRLVDTGRTEMNLAPAHSLCILYRKTKEQKYLDMALQIVDEFAAEGKDGPLAGDYLRAPLAGKEFFETPKPRWESLHPIMALAELYSLPLGYKDKDLKNRHVLRKWLIREGFQEFIVRPEFLPLDGFEQWDWPQEPPKSPDEQTTDWRTAGPIISRDAAPKYAKITRSGRSTRRPTGDVYDLRPDGAFAAEPFSGSLLRRPGAIRTGRARKALGKRTGPFIIFMSLL